MGVPDFDAGLVIGSRTADPTAQEEGHSYWNSVTKRWRTYNGTVWIDTNDPFQLPDCWTIIGHSYVNGSAGSVDQTGRVDSILRGAFDTEANNFQNHAIAGARLCEAGANKGGWTRVMKARVPSLTRGGPYSSAGGAGLILIGINDLGWIGNDTQVRNSFMNSMRASISRLRSSRIYEDTDAAFTYGAGFTQLAGVPDIGSGSSARQATTTTAATITYVIPADYKGETITFQFWGVPHATGGGGTVTFSGTAGVTGTVVTSAAMPAGSLSQTAIVKRVTGLTSSNAGQNIIMTVSSIDASGTVYFDCAWLEALAPPAVLVCNINRLTAAGYGAYGGWSGTEGTKDADVQAWNVLIAGIVNEFDGGTGMVQLVDIDTIINKDPYLTLDGIHPNEYGAGLIVDAIRAGLKKITITTLARGATAHMNPPSKRAGQQMRPRVRGQYYTADCRDATTANAVAQEMFAIPFQVTGADEHYDTWGIETTGAIAGTAVRAGIYDDVAYEGYPQFLVVEFTVAGAFSITNTAAVKTQSISFPHFRPNPSLYWLVLKYTTAGVTHPFRCVLGPSQLMPNCSTAGSPGTKPAGWRLQTQGTGVFPTIFPTGATAVDTVPAMVLRRTP